MAVTSRTVFSTPPKTATTGPSSLPESAEVRAVSKDREVRCLMTGVQLRAVNGRPGTAMGYAAVFDKFSVDLGGFLERIRPGAFSGVLSQDVRALKNHDPAYLLGRATNRSLRMYEDHLGLRVEIDLPDTQTGRDTATEISDGLLDGMSFSFVVDVDEWDYSGDMAQRTIIRVRDLYDVGPVTFPAYTDTSVAMRSLDSRRPRPESSQASSPSPFVPLSIYQARLRVAAAF
jgi:uncharacterized protein